ncbi:MAG TPA: hypothetical protein VFP93_02790 [Gammaproteobacteria bacterium]|nr:hypothetical protein [Gammaproteobacteria bacterium]
MNTVLANNTDLEIWEGWVGDTHSIAATWYRQKNKAQCGFQVFSTWHGYFTLMLLHKDVWQTPVSRLQDPRKVRQLLFKYMSDQIAHVNRKGALTPQLEKSFQVAQESVNQWVNEQVKVLKWFVSYK